MEYVRLSGQFPKLTKSAVTLGKFDGIQETDPDNSGAQKRIWRTCRSDGVCF